MKRVIAFIILYSLFVIFLCPSTNAQWEEAEVQRLTYNNLLSKVKGLYIQEDDKLLLFYRQKGFDSLSWTYWDKLFVMTKEEGGEWSQPEKIGNPSFDIASGYGTHLGYDTNTGVTHIFYTSYPYLGCAETLYYTNSNVCNWEVTKVDSLEGYPDDYGCIDIAFDTLGNIHFIWNVDFDSIGWWWYRVMYANNSTGEWVKQQVSEPICLGYYSASNPSYLAVQKNGTAHIVYHGEPCYLECVSFYARNDSLNSTNWITDTVPKPSRPLWHYWVSHMKVDVSDRVHLLTVGCIDYDCPWPDTKRTFYYYKQAEDSIWQGEEQIPDTALGERLPFGYRQLVIDQQGIPYVSYLSSDGQVYFTDRKQGGWRVPYLLVDWREDPDSVAVVEAFDFVLDPQGKGHGAFSGANMWHAANFDSLEIYYFSSSSSSVDSFQNSIISDFNLFQNYPNPFNSSTVIAYVIVEEENVNLKIYDILGREVRELASKSQEPGYYNVNWDGKNNQGKEVASGIYFYLLRAGERKEGKKMLLIR